MLVEGLRDQIAVETLARRCGRDLAAESIVVLPIGGAHGIARYLRRFGPEGTGARLAGVCDAAEAHILQHGLAATGLGTAGSPTELEKAGLLRLCRRPGGRAHPRRRSGAGVGGVRRGWDLGAFRTIQRQPAWRGKDEAEQLRRFLGAGLQRKLRYVRLMIEAISLDQIPQPLAALLTAV